MSSDYPALKEIYFSDAFVARLAADVQAAYSPASAAALVRLVHVPEFAGMRLKEKMGHVRRCLHEVLPDSFPQALEILRPVAPRYPDFDGMVFSDYVAAYGQDHWSLSLDALREFTRTISAEFAIRPFLRHDQPRALAAMELWAADPHPGVRRLASEGCRPRLPWGISLPALKRDPRPILPILEQLIEDPDESVRRSVGNNLNDIAKDHPQLVLDIATEWYGRSPEADWVVRHGCRSLLKAGDEQALRLFGFEDPGLTRILYLAIRPSRLPIGGSATLHFDLRVDSAEPVLLRLEYAITFVKAYGKTSRKVLHLREREFAPGHHVIEKRHSFRDLSTRKHYPGEHHIEILVNGVPKASGALLLEAAP